MATFKDGQGQDWKLHLTVGSVADVLRETKVNLTVASKDTAWVDAIFGEPGKLVEILWVLCEPEALKREITPEQFPHLFDGPTLERAGDALAEAIADFFPRSRVAKALRGTWSKTVAAAEDRVIAKLESPLTDSPSPMSAQGSSGSIPEG